MCEKVTKELVDSIRQLYVQGHTRGYLSRKFKLNRTIVNEIIAYRGQFKKSNMGKGWFKDVY